MSPSTDHINGGSDTAVPKMAIKGFSLTSKPNNKPLSFATKPKSSPSPLLGKRPRAALHDDSDDEDERPVRHEEVTAFDIREGGAVRKTDIVTEGPLVIPKMKNRDWREELRKGRRQEGKNLLPPEVQAQRAGKGLRMENVVVKEGEEPVWGLSVSKKIERVDDDVQPGKEDDHKRADIENTVSETVTAVVVEKTDDQLAIEALMGVKTEKKGPDLVIPAAVAAEEVSYNAAPMNEEDAYRRAIRAAPDVSTLEDYERVPVEEFGAALLRGMGWKEGDAKKGRVERPKEVKRRQNLLGLGATELKGAEELGAWVQKTDPKRMGGGRGGGGDRRPKANEYREREERKRESRDEKYGGSHRRERDDYRDRDRDRDRERERDRDRRR